MLGNFFNIFAIFYAFRGLQIAATVVKNWAGLRGPDFTPQDKSLAGQAAFFLAVPVGVFFHELAHAVFVVAFGGRIIEFGYRVFWGFVEHSGIYTASQSWLISLAGTLGSLLFGLAVWLAFRNSASPTFQYFGLRAFRYQIFFSLLYYPVFTLLGFYGDWRTIYNFSATPLLSGATAVVHAGLLFGFWRADRSGFFEMGAFESVEAKEKIEVLEEKAAAAPFDTNLQLALIGEYQQRGMINKARQFTQKFLKENPNSAEGYLQLSIIEGGGNREVSSTARKHAEKALNLGLTAPDSLASAHQIVGRYNLGVNKLDEAINQFSRAVEAVKNHSNPDVLISPLYHRALAHRQKKAYDAAYRDIQQAIRIARDGNQEDALSFLNKELEIIAHHSGRSLDQFQTPVNH